mmetsp:Transcript_25654/g.59857  ORF Transcript_25654/g.59857 Transcript_25654/m.59857 type:complete len:495 (-) Transcript_25654:144-1628(-)
MAARSERARWLGRRGGGGLRNRAALGEVWLGDTQHGFEGGAALVRVALWRRQLGGDQPRDLVHVDGHAVVRLVAEGQLRGVAGVVGERVEGLVGPVDRGPFKGVDVHRLRADALVVAHPPPEALVHEQDARHRHGPLHAQRLHRRAQAAVDDEGVHLAEEHPKVRALGLEQRPLRLELLHLRRHGRRHRVALPFAHVQQREGVLRLGEHPDGDGERSGARHWHRREGHHHQLLALAARVLDETVDGRLERAAAGRRRAQEDEIGALERVGPVRGALEGGGQHRDDDGQLPLERRLPRVRVREPPLRALRGQRERREGQLLHRVAQRLERRVRGACQLLDPFAAREAAAVDREHRVPVVVGRRDAARLQAEADGGHAVRLAAHERDAREREGVDDHVDWPRRRLQRAEVVHDDGRRREEVHLGRRHHQLLQHLSARGHDLLGHVGLRLPLRVAARAEEAHLAGGDVGALAQHEAAPPLLGAEGDAPAELAAQPTR